MKITKANQKYYKRNTIIYEFQIPILLTDPAFKKVFTTIDKTELFPAFF